MSVTAIPKCKSNSGLANVPLLLPSRGDVRDGDLGVSACELQSDNVVDNQSRRNNKNHTCCRQQANGLDRAMKNWITRWFCKINYWSSHPSELKIHLHLINRALQWKLWLPA